MLLTVQGGRLKRGGVFGEGGPFEVSARPSHGHPGGCQSSGASLVAPCPTAAGGSMDSVQTQGWGQTYDSGELPDIPEQRYPLC